MGAEASCSDGPAGKVIRVIVDPATDTVTHLVIEPRLRLSAARLVPLDLVDVTADGIRLRCTVEEFGALEAAEETELMDGLDGGFGLVGLGGPLGAPAPVPVVVQDVSEGQP